MRRLTMFFVLATALAIAPLTRAQEPKPAGENTRTEERGEPSMGWQIANFAILAGFLAYMIAKNAGKFFQARGEQIQRSLADAAKEKRAAEERLAEIERRLTTLSDEIEGTRKTMRQEMAAEGERIRMETERHIRTIQEQAQQEIESMIKTARRELMMYSAEQALRWAEEQLEGRITNDVENSLVTKFITDLRAKNGGGSVYN